MAPSNDQVSHYGPGWFHPGAIKPDFNTVDVRKTQELLYLRGREYSTSDLNPGEAFRSSDIEFNSMTKYFYTDRSLPKKRLTESEMLEINRLYRIIGQCEQKIAQLNGSETSEQSPTEPLNAVLQYMTSHKTMLIAGAIVLLVILFLCR